MQSPFTQSERKGLEQQQQTKQEKQKQNHLWFAFDFQSKWNCELKPFSNDCCSPMIEFEICQFETNNRLNFATSNCLTKEFQMKPTVTGQSQEGIMCSDTGLSEHTCSVTKPFRHNSKHIPTVFCSFDSLIHSTEDKHFIKHVSSHRVSKQD